MMSDRPLARGGAVAVVGAGRMGGALATNLRAAGVAVEGPLGRGAHPQAGIVLLAVPDSEIVAAAALVGADRIVGHLSGATTLDPLPHADAFSIHPLLPVTGDGTSFAGVPAALAATSPAAHEVAVDLAGALGLEPFDVADADRAAYHAAASIAANHLMAVEGFAEELAATAGVARAVLAPLVEAGIDAWQRLGAAAALTGPIARGDEATVARQRAAVAERLPARLELYDALTAATRELAGRAAAERELAGLAVARSARVPRVVRSIAELRAALAGASAVRFVPTMGALHAGHLSLLNAAREDGGTLVLSIFVNPTQFDEQSDLDAYPRTEEHDLALAGEAGVDVVFAPDAAEMYPPGFTSAVSVRGPLAETLEGAQRGRAHFDGVVTIVLKLLLAVQPTAAYFGAKDAQQVAVVRRMVADLGVPVEIVVCPTSRDADGLARSSRNVRLDCAARERALAIPRALRAVSDAAAAGERDAAVLCARALAVLSAAGLEPEYVAVVDPESFASVTTIGAGALLAIAARVGTTRLIDNVLITPGGAS